MSYIKYKKKKELKNPTYKINIKKHIYTYITYTIYKIINTILRSNINYRSKVSS